MISISQWKGLVTNASPYALPAGACAEQINMQCLRPGQIESRRGYAFSASVGSRVISAVQFRSGQMVCHAADGGLYVVTVS